ncbi:hypothetical protein CHLNCDRAFT_133457 [Chlorella variabilis]|uniref:Uncharacterized protein n=1 Tax=Chlorella variabilis TaxID=554065 RepID=E1Z352_CHLVA|nr:hypothetical protein CHLNCDRAFT_133457 [Chlorella variabilis]EFN60111.1 hypothetical protein CHLNCDRAFT_133457 [Chlorella variabilis]|eukprot:XP_005852213.1 hypothetical protein CHLNCDRAFT_133457 [Chlorella variabilis]
MNWIARNGKEPWVPYPRGRGWYDLWWSLHGERSSHPLPGWTYDPSVVQLKGETSNASTQSRLDRFLGRLPDWRPAHMEVVGGERICDPRTGRELTRMD